MVFLRSFVIGSTYAQPRMVDADGKAKRKSLCVASKSEENEDGFVSIDGSSILDKTDLVSSILNGDDEGVESQLEQNHDVNKADASGCTPLHYASYVGNTLYIEMLLDRGAHIDVRDVNNITPLHRAVEKDNFEAVDRLLSSGAKESPLCKLFQSPLHVAASHNAVASLKLLLPLSGDAINKTDKHGNTALHHAAYYNNGQIVDLLIEFNADVTIKDLEGRTAIHWASIGGADQKVMARLLSAGCDVGGRDKRGRTPLHYAAYTGKVTVLDDLIRQLPGWVDVRDNDGFTPMHYATQSGHVRCIKLLLEKGADLSSESIDGMNAAHIAAAHTENSHSLDLIISLVNGRDRKKVFKCLQSSRKGGFTPLHLACDQGKISRVDALIQAGVNPHAKADGDIQPIHVAARAGHHLVVKHLLNNHGVDINAAMRDGLCPLHLASFHSFVSTVTLLVESGCDVNAKDRKGRTPLHLASLSTNEHNEYCVDKLLGKGAEVNVSDKQGFTPLHYAASKGNAHVVEKLLRADADTEAVDNRKMTALHYAVLNKHNSKVIQALCKSNDRLVERKDDMGFYPIHYAACRGNQNLVIFLLDLMSEYELPSSGNPLHLTPLHIAAAYDRPAVVKALLTAATKQAGTVEQCFGYQSLCDRIGLETDAKTRIPLHYAMQYGYLECVKALLSVKGSVKKQINWEDKSGITPLHAAAANGHGHCVLWVMSTREASVNKTDSMKRTCGMVGVTGKLDSARLQLILDKACLTQVDKNGRGYLHRAVYVSNVALIKRLLTQCDVNQPDEGGVTPLHLAAAVGEKEVIDLLIQAGANVKATDKEGRLPADWAAANGKLETLEELAPIGKEKKEEKEGGEMNREHDATVSSPPSPSSPLPFSPSAVLLSSKRGHLTCLTHLFALSKEIVKERDRKGRTALHLAALHVNFDCLEFLVECNSDMEAVDEDGRTALMLAAMHTRATHIVAFLLEQGAGIGKVDVDGNTILHLVCLKKNEDAARLLVASLKEMTDVKERNEITHRQNNKGETVLHLITKHGMFDYLVDIVPYCGPCMWMKDKRDRYPITCAVEDQEVVECMNLLLGMQCEGEEKKAPSRKNSQGSTTEFY